MAKLSYMLDLARRWGAAVLLEDFDPLIEEKAPGDFQVQTLRSGKQSPHGHFLVGLVFEMFLVLTCICSLCPCFGWLPGRHVHHKPSS